MAIPASADFVPEVYEARQAWAPPAIDGDLSDAVWATAERIEPFFAFQSGGDPPAADTTLRLLWDDDYLYVAMEAADQNIRSSCALQGDCGHDAPLYNGDVLELFVRPNTTSTRYFEFEWSPLGEDFDARFDTRFGSPGISWESGMASAVTVDGTADNTSDQDVGWIAEARIPITAIDAGFFGAGDQWTFTGARYDYFNHMTGGTALMMSTRGDPDARNGGVTSGFHTYEIYDTLSFVGATPFLEADFNGDGVVDAADYTVWRDQLGATGLDPWAPGDGDGDGDVDVEDYQAWQNQYGQTLADLVGLAAVPEPASAASLALLLAGAVIGVRARVE